MRTLYWLTRRQRLFSTRVSDGMTVGAVRSISILRTLTTNLVHALLQSHLRQL